VKLILELIKYLRQGNTPWTKIDELLKLPPDGARNKARSQEWYKQIAQSNPHDKAEDVDKKTYREDGSISSFIRTRLDNKQTFSQSELLELHGLDPIEFKVKTITSNEWSMTNGQGDKYYNFQSKILAEPILSSDITPEQMAELLIGKIKPVEVKKLSIGENNLVIQLADLHFGVTKLKDTTDKLAKLVDRIDYGYKTIVIEQLGDLFHSSQMRSSQTLRGTLLDDVDMTQAIEDAKTFYDVVLTKCLECSQEVIIEHASGNHSGNIEYMFLIYLESKYPEVKVNYHNDTRTAYQLDKVGIMLSHGDTVALNKLPMLFANEYKQMWADSEVCEVHTAHKHNKYTEQEIDGVVLRQAPTIKPNDLYEITNGWTSNRKIMQVIEYDEWGEVGSYVI